jgi:hypothetical protein
MTMTPLIAPVAMQTFASGHLRHHSLMTRGSVLAFSCHSLILGCLPGEAQFGLPHVHEPERARL